MGNEIEVWRFKRYKDSLLLSIAALLDVVLNALAKTEDRNEKKKLETVLYEAERLEEGLQDANIY